MVKYLRSNSSLDLKQDRCLVVDHSRTGELVDIEKANFLFSEQLLSPMGESLSAFGSKDSLNQYLQRFGGQAISWNELSNRVK
jgi:copper chaperone NosL